MSIHKFMSNNASYHSWVTKKFTDWLSAKPDELLHKEVPSSFNSIIKTLNHIWGTDEYWYSIIAETTGFVPRYHATEFDTEEIMKGISHRADELSKLIDTFDDAKISKAVKVVSPWFQSELPKYEYVQHVINHATYHRGQIVTMAHNVGIKDAFMTDYNFFNVNKLIQ